MMTCMSNHSECMLVLLNCMYMDTVVSLVEYFGLELVGNLHVRYVAGSFFPQALMNLTCSIPYLF